MTRLTGDVGGLTRAVAQAKAAIKSLKDESGEVPITFKVDTRSLARARTYARQLAATFPDGKIPIDFEINKASVAKVVAASEAIDKGARVAAGGWRFFGMNFWQAARTIITASGELAAILVPATIAAGAGAFVMYQAAVEMAGRHLQALYTTTEATGAMFHKTAGDVLGLGHAMQKAQDMAQPNVWQLMGAYLGIARSRAGDLASMGYRVTQVLDTLAAKIRLDMQSSAGQVSYLRDRAVPALTDVGQVFGNLSHAIFSLASKMPGVAEILLSGINDIAKAVLWFSKLPTAVVKTTLALEAAHRWGGLLSRTVIGPLAGKLGTLAGKFKATEGAAGALGKASKFLSGTWGWVAVAGIGIGVYLVRALMNAKDATQKWIATSNEAIQKASNFATFNVIQDQMVKTSSRVAQAQKQLSSELVKSGNAADFTGRGYYRMGQAASSTGGDIALLQRHTTSLQQGTMNLAKGAAQLERQYGVNYPGALMLADQANVKLYNGITGNSQAAEINRLKIADLVAGYQAMAQPLGVIGKDMSALGIQSELAGTQVQKLNQAWDQWMQGITGGTNGMAQLVTGIHQMNNEVAATSASLSGSISSVKLAGQSAGFTLKGSSLQAAQSWQNFDSVVGQTAPQIIDWLRTAGTEGALSSGKFTEAVRAMVGQLLPFAQHSKTATTELSALAQQAGGPSTSSFQTLKAWVDRGHHSMGDFQSIIDSTTQKMGNMAQVAQNLGAVVQSQIIQMMDKAKLTEFGANQAIQAYTQAIKNNGAASTQAHTTYQHLVQVLTKVTGSHREAVAIARTYGRTLGDDERKTRSYTGSLQKLEKAFKNLHNKAVDVKVNGKGVWVDTFGNTPVFHHRPTGRAKGVVGLGHGYGGGDRYPAMLEAGESVVPKHLTPAVAPFLKAHGVPGYAQGLIGKYSGSPAGLPPWVNHNYNASLSEMGSAMGKAIKNEMSSLFTAHFTGGNQRAISTGRRMAAAAGWGGGQFNALYNLWMRESGWNPYAVNPSSGAYGIPQSLGHGHPYALGDIPAQIAWGLNYIRQRYGSPMAAWAHEVGFGWYDQGGYLNPGFTLAYNGTGAPEPVGAAAGGGDIYVESVVYLDGKQIYRNTRKQATRTQVRTGHTGLERTRR